MILEEFQGPPFWLSKVVAGTLDEPSPSVRVSPHPLPLWVCLLLCSDVVSSLLASRMSRHGVPLR